jgi:hypothetical protein
LSHFPAHGYSPLGHGSANGLADRDLIARCLRSLLGLVVTAGFGGAPCISVALAADDAEVVAEGETLLITIANDTRAGTVAGRPFHYSPKNNTLRGCRSMLLRRAITQITLKQKGTWPMTSQLSVDSMPLNVVKPPSDNTHKSRQGESACNHDHH